MQPGITEIASGCKTKCLIAILCRIRSYVRVFEQNIERPRQLVFFSHHNLDIVVTSVSINSRALNVNPDSCGGSRCRRKGLSPDGQRECPGRAGDGAESYSSDKISAEKKSK
jgi:hypothetical protein